MQFEIFEDKIQSRTSHTIKAKDYITTPKDDGYRGIHLTLVHENAKNNLYDGLQVELQLRTRIQHAWSTAVEACEAIAGGDMKRGEGEKEWREFFRFVSSGFAMAENCAPVPAHSGMLAAEVYGNIKELESELRVLEHLERTESIRKAHQQKGSGNEFLLLVLNETGTDSSTSVIGFKKSEADKATEEYNRLEQEISENTTDSRKVVLVSAGNIKKARKAFPNFFLDTSEFQKHLKNVIRHAR